MNIKLSRDEILLIMINGLFSLANGMAAVFMNVYLYAYTGSLVVMTIYTIIRIGLFPFAFTFGGKWAQRHRLAHTLVSGLVLIMLSLVVLLFFNEAIAEQPNLVYIIAAIFGAGEGLFWLSINSLNQMVTSKESRAKYMGFLGMFNGCNNIVAPLVAAWIVDISFDDVAGYVNIFKLVLIVYAAISALGMMVKCSAPREHFSVLKCLKFKNDPQWRYVLTSHIFYGIRDSIALTLAGLLIYNATGGSGSAYGRLLAIFAVLSIVSYFIAARVIKRHNRLKIYTCGAILVATSTIVLVLFPSIYGAIFYGVVYNMAVPFYANPFSIITMNAISDYSEENVMGRVIAKECALSVGRITGMLMTVVAFMVLPENLYLPVSVSFASLFAVFLVIYASIYHKKRDAQNNKSF